MRSILLGVGLLALVACVAPLARGHYPMLLLIGERGERVGPVFTEGDWVTCDLTIGHPFADDRFNVEKKPAHVFLNRPQGGEADDLVARITTITVAFDGHEVEAWRLRWKIPKREAGDFVLTWHTEYFEKPHRELRDYTKIFVHVPGPDTPGQQLGWSQSTKAPIEILPLTRPYWIPVGGVFRGQVVQTANKQQTPMRGAVVEAETWGAGPVGNVVPELAAYRRAELTDPSGCFGLSLDRAGWWLVSVATDGGPGEQGGLPEGRITERAVAWIFVGPPPREATYDHFPGSKPRNPANPPVPVHPDAPAQPPK